MRQYQSLDIGERRKLRLGVSGFGARRPLSEAQGETEADYSLNRRIDLRFLLARSAELERLHNQIEAALKENEK